MIIGDEPPTTFRDAELTIDGLEIPIEEFRYDISTDGMLKTIAAEKEQMFYAGLLYGMALESTKDRPLEARHIFK